MSTSPNSSRDPSAVFARQLRIVICSTLFAPSIGGLEKVMEILSREFCAAGHSVVVVSRTPGPDLIGEVPVVRRPGLLALVRLFRSADIVLHAGAGLRYTPLSLVIAPRRTVVIHHTWADARGGIYAARSAVLRFITRRVVNVGVSRAMTESLPGGSICIPNPYDAGLFESDTSQPPRDGHLLFVGRLVSQKGVDILISALATLEQRGKAAQLTIVGEGPERERLSSLAAELGLRERVHFRGALLGAALAEVYRRHRIVVIPSQ